MSRDGVLTQAETLGDLPVCQPGPGELEYLDFPFAEAGPPPTLGHEASASFEIVVAPSETREKLVGARGAERSERFDGRKSRRKRRRGIVDMPHRDLEQDGWTASRRGELDEALPFVRSYRDPGWLATLSDEEGPRHLDGDFQLVAETFRRFAEERCSSYG